MKVKLFVWAFLVALFYLIFMEVLSVWSFIGERIDPNFSLHNYAFIQGFLQLCSVFIFIYFIRNKTLKNLVRKTDTKWYILAFSLGILYVFIQTPLNWLYNLFFEVHYNIHYNFDGFVKFKKLNVLAVVLFIPICEELLFRRYIQHTLQKKISILGAVLYASILFALIHAPYINLILEFSNEDWHRAFIALFGGLISGVLYYKSNSIGPSILFHILWNIIAIIT